MIPVTKENVLVFMKSINAYTHYSDAYYGHKVADLIVASAQYANRKTIGEVIAILMDSEARAPFLAAATKDKDHAMKIAVTIGVFVNSAYGIGVAQQHTTVDVLEGLHEQLVEMRAVEKAAMSEARNEFIINDLINSESK